MPSKKPSAPGTPAPSKSSCQRTLTNKQQQLRKIVVVLLTGLILLLLLVAQKNEKEEATKRRALTGAIWSEQRNEELNGFHQTKERGKVYLT
jgi:hypothetical protein